MNRDRRLARICARFASRDMAEDFGPVEDLDTEDRAWRRRKLALAFQGYRDGRVMGVGTDWQEALEDAEAAGRIDLAEYDRDLGIARDALLQAAIWEFTSTPDGVAILDTCAR